MVTSEGNALEVEGAGLYVLRIDFFSSVATARLEIANVFTWATKTLETIRSLTNQAPFLVYCEFDKSGLELEALGSS